LPTDPSPSNCLRAAGLWCLFVVDWHVSLRVEMARALGFTMAWVRS
jgi:hypothetical protein